MATVSFKLDKLFKLHVPLLIMFRHGFQQALLSKKTKVGGCGIAKKTKRDVVNANSRVRWQTARNDRQGCKAALLLSILVTDCKSKTCPMQIPEKREPCVWSPVDVISGFIA
jgi:hypothetical protein